MTAEPHDDPHAMEIAGAALLAMGAPVARVGLLTSLEARRGELDDLTTNYDDPDAARCTACRAVISSPVASAVDACPFCLEPFYEGDEDGEPAGNGSSDNAQTDDEISERLGSAEDQDGAADFEDVADGEDGPTVAPDAVEDPIDVPDVMDRGGMEQAAELMAMGVPIAETARALFGDSVPPLGGAIKRAAELAGVRMLDPVITLDGFPREPAEVVQTPADESGEHETNPPEGGEEDTMGKAIAKVIDIGDRKVKGPVKTFTRSELEDRTRELIQLSRNYSQNAWQLAVALRDTLDSGMWAAGGHKSFDAYVEAEVRFSAKWAKHVVEASREFTQEQFTRIGETNAVQLLRLPESSDRKKWAKKLMDAPMTKRELDAALTKDIPKQANAGGRPKVRLDVKELVGRPIVIKLKDDKGDHELPAGYVLRAELSGKKLSLRFEHKK